MHGLLQNSMTFLMETAYLASIYNIIQKGVCYWWKKQLGDLVSVVVEHKTVSWQFWLLPPRWWTTWHEKIWTCSAPPCLAKWRQLERGRESLFYQGRNFEIPTRPGCLHNGMKVEGCSNGKLERVWIIYFSIFVPFPAKIWHSGVNKITVDFKGELGGKWAK